MAMEHRDTVDTTDKPYLTTPTFQQDLERRLDDDYVPDSDRGDTVTVNPNPFGTEEYAGTDPIYQNHANETEKPLASKKGAVRLAEEQVKELHNLDEVDEGELSEDYGLGGKARKTGDPNLTAITYLVPGQEGYDRELAEEQGGPPLRVDVADARGNGDDEEGDDEVTEADNPGTNMGASTAPPEPPSKTGSKSDRAGTRTGDDKNS